MEKIKLKTALYFLLIDQFDVVDILPNIDDDYFVEEIINVLIQKNKNTCPFKNYGSTSNCEFNTNKCKRGFKITCGIEPKTIWKNFMV